MISSKTNNIIKLSMIILAILSILPGCRAANSITRIIIDEGETDRMELAYKYESGRCSEDELERYIGTMPEVESAYVSMAGSTAIINLSLNDKFTDDKILQIKETVTESVAALSNAPPHVVVNTNANAYRNICGIKKGGTDTPIPPEKRALFPILPNF